MSNQLAKVFAQGASSLGLDDDASGALIGNLNATVTPMCIGSPFDDDENETDDFRLVFFALDGSGSMEDVQQDVRDSFNEIVIPGLLGGARDQVGAIRYGGLVYGTSVKPLWKGGWHKLTDNPPRITANEYSASGATALHQGVMDAFTAAASYATQVRDRTGTNPEVTIVCVGDGANNQPPNNPSQIKAIADKLSPELFTLVFIGFETYEPVDFTTIAKGLGFRDIMDSKAKPGETKDEQRRRFRHVMRVFSSQLIQRVSTSQVGTSSGQPAGGSSGFWSSNP